ncbi:MAG: hypothetical protein RJA99_584 [Pseudomonadota bacterium]|jgi:beta-mannosidase
MSDRVRPSDGRGERRLDAGWTFRATEPGRVAHPSALDDDPAAWRPATVPCTVASARRALGDWGLDGPPERFDAHDWWFRTSVELDPPAAGERRWLCLDGLATLAEVWLDGEPLLSSASMFVAHRVPIPDAPRTRRELVIRFRSLDAALAGLRERPRWRAPMVENQKLRRVRTTLLGRTPGWSPPAAAVGPWRPVRIETVRGDALEVLALDATVEGDTGVLRMRVRGAGLDGAVLAVTHGGERRTAPLSGSASAGGVRDASSTDGVRDASSTGRSQASAADEPQASAADVLEATVVVPDVARWWPNGYGEPALYAMTVERDGRVLASLGSTGFRTLSIDREADGEGFRVVVNGVPVFARGACWMPVDPVALAASPDAQASAVASARDAGFTMLRVCGPTVYEDDAFHDACDAAGLLVWQDLMFANLDYPGDDEAFAASAALEVAQQLARLRARPSLAVVCGNSEVSQQAAMSGAPREAWDPPLFATTLREVAARVLPATAYWPSSAWGGAFPHQARAGTTSWYGVGAYLRPLDDATVDTLRFATECLGFANVPEPAAIDRMPGGASIRVHHPAWKARTPRDLGAGWDFDDVRDAYLARVLGVDATALRTEDPERHLELSRVASGEAIRRTLERWRTGDRCGGALVWTLRDLWAGAGWGLLDDRGEPKAAWWLARAASRPIAIAVTDHGTDGLRLHVLNDGPVPLDASIALERLRGGEPVGTAVRRAVAVPAHGRVAVDALAMLDGFEDLNHAYRFGPRAVDAVVATLHAADGTVLDRRVHWIGERLSAPDRDAGLSVAVERLADGRPALRIRAERLARWVVPRLAQHVPDDAYFDLPPGGELRVGLRPRVRGAPVRGTVHALSAERRTRIDG